MINIDEANYPSHFNMDVFKGLTSFVARRKYLESALPKLGQGSSRAAFKIDDETVIKLAINKKGLAQNESEVSHFQDLGDYSGHILAKIYDHQEDYHWIEAQLAIRAKPNDFQRILDVPFEYFAEYVFTEVSMNRGKIKFFKGIYNHIPKEILESLKEMEFTNDLMEFAYNTELAAGDLKVITSYGVVKEDGDEKIVLIDYGATDDIIKNLYRR